MPVQMFGLLDMWDALVKALSQVSSLLEGTAGAAIVASLEDLQEAVQREARAGYLDLEASIGLEFAKTEVQLESTVRPSSWPKRTNVQIVCVNNCINCTYKNMYKFIEL